MAPGSSFRRRRCGEGSGFGLTRACWGPHSPEGLMSCRCWSDRRRSSAGVRAVGSGCKQGARHSSARRAASRSLLRLLSTLSTPLLPEKITVLSFRQRACLSVRVSCKGTRLACARLCPTPFSGRRVSEFLRGACRARASPAGSVPPRPLRRLLIRSSVGGPWPLSSVCWYENACAQPFV